MKLAIGTILALVALASSSPAQNPLFLNFVKHEEWDPAQTFLTVEKAPGVYENEDLLNSKIQLKASKDDVSIFFYCKNNQDAPVKLAVDDVNTFITYQHYDSKKPHFFVSHGWNNNYKSDINVMVKTNILKEHDVNVFVVDWSGPANKNYVTARNAVKVVGESVGDFINSLIEAKNINLKETTLIGHSLGAHVAGSAGARVNGLVGTIIGLDPAFPLFIYNHIDSRLDTTDGEFVHVIHTCAGLLGMKRALGHIDFYPNGGSSQPGCGLDVAGTCAHSRSYEYFAESILDNKFVSVECGDEYEYADKKCSKNPRALMGGYQVDKTVKGTYYLDTNKEEPWAKGDIY